MEPLWFVYLLTEYHPAYPAGTLPRADVVRLITRHRWPVSAFRVIYYPRLRRTTR